MLRTALFYHKGGWKINVELRLGVPEPGYYEEEL